MVSCRTIHASAPSSKKAASRKSNCTPSQKFVNARLPVQTKLEVSTPGNSAEYEAEAISDKVMSIPDNFIHKSNSINSEGTVYGKPLKSFIQRKAESEGISVSSNVANEIRKTQGGGNKLDRETKNFMESRFGTSLSDVNIHTGEYAERLSKSLGAYAFTVGNDIYFNRNKFAPADNNGKKLLAHELTHHIQQKQTSDNSQGSSIQKNGDPKLEAIKEKIKRKETLSADEIEYAEQQIGKEVLEQILGKGGAQIQIDYDSSKEPENINRRYQGILRLKLTGLPAAAAKSFEGSATTDIDFVAKVKSEKGTITLSPPTEDSKLAAMIREMFFPNNSVRTFDFDFSKKSIKLVNSVFLIGGITVSISGKGAKSTEGSISIHHESVPSGVELIVTLLPSARSTSVEETKRIVPGNYSLLTPNPRLFGTLGYGRSSGQSALASTLGVDLPLHYDTSKPYVYLGLGARGSIDTNRFSKVGGTFLVGLNFDPLSLQFGIGLGAAFLKDPIQTPSGPAQTFLYSEVEGSVSYRVVSNFELLLMLTAGGGKDLPGYGTAQLGGAYRF